MSKTAKTATPTITRDLTSERTDSRLAESLGKLQKFLSPRVEVGRPPRVVV